MANTAIRDSAASSKHPAHDQTLSPTSSSALDRVRSLLVLIGTDRLISDKSDFLRYAEEQCDRLRELHVILIDTNHRHGRVKDDFRRANGFDTLLAISQNVALLWSNTGPDQSVFELLKLSVGILSAVLLDHSANRHYFAKHANVNRWLVLQQHVVAFGTAIIAEGADGGAWLRKLLDVLFSFALREDGDSKILAVSRRTPSNARSAENAELRSQSRRCILWIPEVLPVIAHVWSTILVNRRASSEEAFLVELSYLVLEQFDEISEHSRYNTVSLNESGIFEVLVDLNADAHLETEELALLTRLRLRLLQNGIVGIHTGLQICQNALKSGRYLDLLEKGTQNSSEPAHFVFDLSLHGYSSLEIAALPKDFPPLDKGGGYTIMTLMRIDDFDDTCHTTLFGAFDKTQTCFLLLYIERESKRLVLQTSLSSDRPSVRFKSITFATGRWYHVAIVHKAPTVDDLGRATLLIDGHAVEKVKCGYPSAPPADSSRMATGARLNLPPGPKVDVQAFLGTPQSLAPQLGTGVLKSRWSVAGCQLVSRALPEELIFVYNNTGPNYVGNFQDSLGSFQTYETSTALNLAHEQLYAGAEDRSIIAKAVKERACLVNDENNFILNVIAAGCINHSYRASISALSTPSQTYRAAPNLIHDTFFNMAGPRSRDTWNMHGGVRLTHALALSNHIWRLCGGVSFAIKLLEVATQEDAILQAIRVIFKLVNDNWRMSEAFEKEGSFPTMALLIRSKSVLRRNSLQLESLANTENPFSLRLLQLILENVGYNFKDPTSSVISNPLAYRALIVDSDIWRSSEGVSQKLYYKQFIDFIATSQHASFNIKRLSRMRMSGNKSQAID